MKLARGTFGVNEPGQTVWITRSQPDADKTAERLRDVGYSPLIAPLIEIVPIRELPNVPSGDEVFVFTSRQAVRIFAALSPIRHVPVVTVGDATADLCRTLGFDNVHSANGTSKDVTRLVANMFPERPVIHYSGETVRGTIVPDLNAMGFAASRRAIYRQEPVKHLPLKRTETINYALFYSPMAGRVLTKLLPDVSHVISVSMSPATDAELMGCGFKARRIAEAPNEDSLIHALMA